MRPEGDSRWFWFMGEFPLSQWSFQDPENRYAAAVVQPLNFNLYRPDICTHRELNTDFARKADQEYD
ncbi:MAG: hypothetical protein D6681_02815 [Calditrichaeota bacterium]|nr:MAG: hypothetical protein D6681_02815 [Calditrichota bacterium]